MSPPEESDATISTSSPMPSHGRGSRELDDLESVFKALAHPARRHVLVVLNARGGEMTAGAIASRFSHKWPTTSRHLRILEDAGLVRVGKRGREWIYNLIPGRLHQVIGVWLDWFPETEPTTEGETETETERTEE